MNILSMFSNGCSGRNNYIWYLSLAMQGITSIDNDEKQELLYMFNRCDGDTGFIHEGFDVNNPKDYTRDWFTWPDSVFSEFVEKCVDEGFI
jgi:meiotically up-regulated gene 157 (Mug157) protein